MLIRQQVDELVESDSDPAMAHWDRNCCEKVYDRGNVNLLGHQNRHEAQEHAESWQTNAYVERLLKSCTAEAGHHNAGNYEFRDQDEARKDQQEFK